jgi:ATP:corrinoid adenosyltransferase
MTSKSPLQKEKIDLAMSGLEKLKQEIASIEAKYGVLDGQYSVICDEALTKINDARLTIQEESVQIENAPENTEVAVTGLKKSPGNGSSLEDIYNYYSYQHPADEPSKLAAPRQKTPVIDDMADAIEFGLDKIGDALVYPFVVVERLHKKLARPK